MPQGLSFSQLLRPIGQALEPQNIESFTIRVDAEKISVRAQRRVEHQAPPPLVLGRHLLDLGVTPGPHMGVLLKTIYERQLDGEITTLDEGLVVAHQIVAGE